jgi:hypothetical protein
MLLFALSLVQFPYILQISVTFSKKLSPISLNWDGKSPTLPTAPCAGLCEDTYHTPVKLVIVEVISSTVTVSRAEEKLKNAYEMNEQKGM